MPRFSSIIDRIGKTNIYELPQTTKNRPVSVWTATNLAKNQGRVRTNNYQNGQEQAPNGHKLSRTLHKGQQFATELQQSGMISQDL